MSFNKRWFSTIAIKEKARDSDFNTFDTWMYKPDACIFEQNDESSDIWNAYMKATEREQYHIYIKLKS